jgi:hypothetical protein
MMKWGREQAKQRGFDPPTNPNIHILMDGETTLYNRMLEYFKKASFSLDIRHLEKKIGEVGRTFEAKGSDELAQWVEPYRTMLYEGQASKLLEKMKALGRTLS